MRKRIFMMFGWLVIMSQVLFGLEFSLERVNSSGYYDNGDKIQYEITIKNDVSLREGETESPKIFRGKLDFLIEGLKNPLDTGGKGFIFSNISNQGQKSDGGNSQLGDYNLVGDLAVQNIVIAPGESIKYITTAEVNENIKGDIKVQAKLYEDGKLSPVETKSNEIPRVGYDYEVSKTSAKDYYEESGEVEYEITIENTGKALIKNLSIKDTLNNLENISISNSKLGYFSDEGDSESDETLDITGINLDVDEVLTYNITGRVKAGYKLSLSSEVKTTVRNIPKTTNGPVLNIVDYNYGVTLKKEGDSLTYIPGEKVTYILEVTNESSSLPITKMKLRSNLEAVTTEGASENNLLAFDLTKEVKIQGEGIDKNITNGIVTLEDISIPVNSSVSYKISTYINEKAVGEIINFVEVTDRSERAKTESVSLKSVSGNLTYSINPENVTLYKPGETLNLRLEVGNDGDGILKNISIVNNPSLITTILANSGSESSADLTEGYPLEYFKITSSLKEGSTKSSSTHLGQELTEDLSDTAILYPKETIIYNIEMKTKSTSIGKIENLSVVNSNNLTATYKGKGNSTDVTVAKTTSQSIYDSTRLVKYEILVKNTNAELIANNFEIIDMLSKIKADNLSGGNTEAIEKWSLKVLEKDGVGTAEGSELIDKTGDLNHKVDIGPKGYIKYELTVKIKDNIVGTVVDKVAGDNTVEDGEGVNMAPSNLTMTKTVSGTTYTPNKPLTYTLRVKNDGQGIGYNVKIQDILSEVQTKLGTTGELGKAYAVVNSGKPRVTITAKVVKNNTNQGVTGSLSNAGSFGNNNDLNINNAVVLPGHTLVYTIKPTVSIDAVGEIKNKAKLNNEAPIYDEGLISAVGKPSIRILKDEDESEENYKPGSTVKFSIEVKNTGTGILYNSLVESKISEVVSDLSNAGSKNSDDVSNSPLSSWTIKPRRASGDTKSNSLLLTSGATLTSQDLSDRVVIYPGKTITYDVVMVTKPTAISEIEVEASIEGVANPVSHVSTPAELLKATDPSIKITKAPKTTSYEGAKEIKYDLIVTNPSSDKYLNNLVIENFLSKIEALDVDGKKVSAVENWSLKYISKEGDGTAEGSDLSNQSGDLNHKVDISAGGHIKYELIVKLKPEIVGDIYDNITGDNVEELEHGISMAASKLEIAKIVNTTEYVPGDTVTYTIFIKNTGKGTAYDMLIEDIFSGIETTHANGELGDAYAGTKVTGHILDEVGKVTTEAPNRPGIVNPLTNKDLSTEEAVILPGHTLVYIVEATVNPQAVEKITNQASIDGKIISDKGIVSKVHGMNISKRVTSGHLPTNLNSSGNKEKDEIVTYEIVVSNGSKNGIVSNATVIDEITEIKGTTLDGKLVSGTDLFSSWTVEKKIEGEETTVSNEIQDADNNISANVTVAPGEKVIFTVKATVKSNIIIYDIEENKATLTYKIGNKKETKSATAAPYKKWPFLRISKEVDNKEYKPGDTVIYTIKVENIGTGYANNASIEDLLKEVKDEEGNLAFKSWTVDSDKAGHGSNPVIIEESDDKFEDKENIKVKADIAPGGHVEYIVTAETKPTAVGTIVNTLTVKNKQNGNEGTASASIGSKNETDKKISLVKYAIRPRLNPGEDFTYYIELTNNTKHTIENIELKDIVSSPNDADAPKGKGKLANSGEIGNLTDVYGDIFTLTSVSGDKYIRDTKSKISETSETVESEEEVFFTKVIDELAAGETIKYIVNVKANPKLLEQNIRNTAEIKWNENGKVVYQESYIDVKVEGESGGLSVTTNKSSYSPGDEVEYTITISSGGPGYLNNYNVNVDFSNIEIELLDGTKGKLFNKELKDYEVTYVSGPEFDIKESAKKDIKTDDIGKQDNIIGSLDLKPGDKLVYKVKGRINEEAVGSINFKGTTISPTRYNLTPLNSFSSPHYSPGEEMEVILRVENAKSGNAQDIPIFDDFKNIKVLDANGNETFAIKEGTDLIISDIKLSHDYASAGDGITKGMVLPNNILDTKIDIPSEGYVEYTIKGAVNDLAVGTIVNKFIVDGDGIGAAISSDSENYALTNTLQGYRYSDSDTSTNGGYKPGTWVEYEIKIENKTDAILDDYIVIAEYTNILGEVLSSETGKVETSELIEEVTSIEVTDGKGNKISTSSTSVTKIEEENRTNGIEDTVDIGPHDILTYKVKLKVKEEAIGKFKTTVDVIDKISRDKSTKVSKEAFMAAASVTHKQIGITGYEQNTKYVPGKEITYTITLENTGNGNSYGKTFVDNIKGIQAGLASINDAKGNPFSDWKVSSKVEGGITNLYFNGAKKEYNEEKVDSINISNVVIAPKGKVTFTIKATVKKQTNGSFTNTSTYAGGNRKQKTLNPFIGRLTTFTNDLYLKEVKHTNEEYKPGDKVHYVIELKNTGNGVINNLLLEDEFEDIVAEQSGRWETTNAPKNITLENIMIEEKILDTEIGTAGETVTFFDTDKSNSSTKIDRKIDINPGGGVRFVVSGNIKKSALGTVSANTTTATYSAGSPDTAISNSIESKQDNIEGSKTLVTPADGIYKPGDEITYEIKMINNGLGYGNNIVLEDLIKLIKTEKIGGGEDFAFEDVEVSETIISSDSEFKSEYEGYTKIKDNLNGTDGIDTIVDIAPKTTLTVILKAKVKANIVGEIINIATVDETPYSAKALTLKPAVLDKINIEKSIPPSGSVEGEYVPDGVLEYEIKLANTSDTTVDDLKLTDIISTVMTEQAGEIDGKAFKNTWTFTSSGDSNLSSVIGLKNSEDIEDVIIDMAKDKYVIIKVKGNATSKSLGDIITNKASFIYDEKPAKESNVVTYKSKPGEISITKSANLDKYIPGQPLRYTLKVKNTGEGYINNGQIKDEMGDIDIVLVDGTTAKAFSEVSIVEEKFDPNTLSTKGSGKITKNNYYHTGVDIHPGETMTIVLEGKVHPDAHGKLSNTAQGKPNDKDETPWEDSNSHETETEDEALTSLKIVDKINYSAEDILTYTIRVTNTGKGWAKNVNIFDTLNDKNSLFIDGIERQALKEVAGSEFSLDETINIPPLREGSEENIVEFVIKGQLKPGVVGEVVNTAKVNNIDTNTVQSTPKVPGLELEITGDDNYEIGKPVDYTITLENTETSSTTVDLGSDILDWKVENNKNETTHFAYSEYKIVSITLPNNSLVSNVETGDIIKREELKDIEIIGTLKGSEKIEIKVEATLNEVDNGDYILTPMEVIKGKAYVSHPLSQVPTEETHDVNPGDKNIDFEKVIVSIGGRPYSSNETYSPNEEIVYEITITNSGLGYSRFEEFSDLVEDMKMEWIGGLTDQPAFSEWAWEVDSYVIGSEATEQKRSIIDKTDFIANEGVTTSMNIAPKSEVKITLTGKISEKATGELPSNTAEFGDDSDETEGVEGEVQDFTIVKSLRSLDRPSAIEEGSENLYVPGGKVVYEVLVTNTRKSNINDLEIKDMISGLQATGANGQPFDAFASIDNISIEDDTYVFTEKNYPNKLDLDDVIDLYMDKSVKFIIEATLNSNIYGEIINTATGKLEGQDKKTSNEVIINSEKPELLITKTAKTTNYSPGDEIHYQIVVENTTSSVASEFEFIDDLNEIKVKPVIGDEEIYPFISHTVVDTLEGSGTYVVENVSNKIKVTGNLGANSKLTLDIKGKTKDNLVGSIKNIASINDNDSNEAEVLPNKGEILIDKTAVDENNSEIFEYIPGEEITYVIEVKNIEQGYALGVEIEDDLGSLSAFDMSKLDLSKIKPIVPDSNLSRVYDIEIKGGKVLAKSDIHPGETIKLEIKIPVLATTKTDITNVARAKYGDQNEPANKTLTSVDADLSIAKTQNLVDELYLPGSQVKYTLEVENNGKGWGIGVDIVDDIGEIKTTILGGTEDVAFDKTKISANIVKFESLIGGEVESHTLVRDIIDGNVKFTGDIPPQSKITIEILGTICTNAQGIIENQGFIKKGDETLEESEIVTASQKQGYIGVTKTSNLTEYIVGQPIIYNIKVENTTLSNMTNESIIDEISKILTENKEGELVQAFKDGWTTEIVSTNNATVKDKSGNEITSIENGKDINVLLDLGSSGSIEFKVTGTVIDDATTTLINEVSDKIKGEASRRIYDKKEVTPKPYEINVTKDAYNEEGDVITTYNPNDYVIYKVKVENKGEGYAKNVVVQDLLSKVMVDIPGGQAKAYNMTETKIKVIENIDSKVSTTIIGEVQGKDLEDEIDLPPKTSITYEIKVKIISNAVGSLGNDDPSYARAKGENGIEDRDNVVLTSAPARIVASMYIEKYNDLEIRVGNYIPGKDVTYHLRIKNEGSGYGYGINVTHLINNIKGKSILTNDEIQAFDSWVINNIGTHEDIEIENLEILPFEEKLINITAKVNENLVGNIEATSKVEQSSAVSERGSKLESDDNRNLTVEFLEEGPKLDIYKTTDKGKNGVYGDEDEFVEYIITVKNVGNSNQIKVDLEDEVSKLVDSDNEPVFSSWDITMTDASGINDKFEIKDSTENFNKTVVLKAEPANTVEVRIKGKLNKGIDDNITNTFKAVIKNDNSMIKMANYVVEDSVTNYIKKTPDNSGELTIYKKAMKDKVKIGNPVEYEIIIDNNNDSYFKGVILKDIIPAGFKYIVNSSEGVYSGEDGVFGTDDDVVSTSDPLISSSLSYKIPDMDPYTKYRIRYVLTPSIGVNFGKYKNQAYATIDGERKSNIASATVVIEADGLLDTASIIGKVFYDNNRDGYQDEGEKGIPGVRLITPRGIIVTTDRFGRYHVPDQWVYSRIGQNAEIKLDATTLPENVEVISENPLVKRITTQGLSKFNFSVAKIEGKEIIDTTRITLEKGAIWVVNSFEELEPQLKLSLPEDVIVRNKKLTEEVEFTVETNYADFIDRYKLEIYAQEDRNMTHPLKVIEGQNLYNDMKIIWNNTDTEYDGLVKGREIKVRLSVWDKEGRQDKTEIGYVDLIARERILDLFTYETKNEANLLVSNIKLNGNIVRFTGDGLKDVDRVIIKDDEITVDDNEFMISKFIPSNSYAMPVVVVYEDGREEEYTLKTHFPDTYHLGTGMIDFVAGKYDVSGNSDVLVDENPYGADYFTGDSYKEGRIAYFGKGRYKDKLRYTIHMDTKGRDISDMFDNFFKKNDQTIFERMEDVDTYTYPTYGDKSYVYRAVDTDGNLYLKAEYEESSIMWGNYETGLDQGKYLNYNRNLYGAKGEYIGKEKTKFGDEDSLVGFISDPYSLFGHDEFLGTGGSLYFLKNNDVLPGSEKVYVKIVNSKTKVIETAINLVEGKDYQFDAYQGRIILSEPLKTMASNVNDDIIQDSNSGDYYNYLVVDYEYIPSDDSSVGDQDYGLYGRKFIGDHIGLGGAYIKESRDGNNYRLKAGELILKFTENSYIKGELSESTGVQSTNSFVSLDGGLSFKEIDTTNFNKTGAASKVEVLINLGDIEPEVFGSYGNEIKLWHEEKEAGYSFASDLEDTYMESFGARLNLRYSDKVKSMLKYEEYEERDLLQNIKEKYKSFTAQIEYLITEKLAGSLAYKHVEELEEGEKVKGQLVGGRLEYEVNEDANIYVEGQVTVGHDKGYETNNMFTLGGEFDVTENLTLDGKTTFGSRGNYSELGLDYKFSDNYSVYFGYSQDGEENQDSLVAGQKIKLGEKLDFYQENQILKEDGRSGRAETYGLDYEIDEDLTIGGSFQYGKIELPDDKGNSKRKAFSLYTSLDKDDYELSNKLEYREEREESSKDKTKQYLTTNNFSYVFSDELTLGGKFNYSYTKGEESSKFIESSIGLAYRPVDNDKLNFLSRYTYLLNDDPNDDEKLKAHVAEFESIYAVNNRIDMALKLAYRDEEETFQRESGDDFEVRQGLYLVGLKLNYTVMNDWDIFLQYHWLVERRTHDVQDGAIVGIYKNIHQNLKIGGGYNFSGFSSEMSYYDYEAEGWFINIIGRI